MKTDIMYQQQKRLRQNIRHRIIFFIIALVLSGLTALGVETQMHLLSGFFPPANTAVGGLLWKVYAAVKDTNQRYPFLAYGYDWLAFSHIVIATAFIGPLQDPVRNRGLPIWWRLIDCSFGIIGAIPLLLCLERIQLLEVLEKINANSSSTSSCIKNHFIYESA
jgi:hypothetical protein